MGTKQENVASETLRQMTSAFEPWIHAAKAWTTETERLQKVAFESMNKALDNSHRMTKEGLDMIQNVGGQMQKQFTAQVERATQMVNSVIP